MSELKPCPFCGGEAHITIEQAMWFIECENEDCGAQMGFEAEVVSRIEAIAAWNRRAQPANEPLTLEQIVEKRGEPLWYRPIGEGTPFDYGPMWFICNLDKLPKPFYSYGKTWLAYDHKQGGEQE